MKSLFGILVLVGGMCWAEAQTNTTAPSNSQIRRTRKTSEPSFMGTPLPPFTGKLGRPPIRYGGLLPDLVKAQRPLRALNPFRPENSGFESENVLMDPRTGRAEGIALLSIRF